MWGTHCVGSRRQLRGCLQTSCVLILGLALGGCSTDMSRFNFLKLGSAKKAESNDRILTSALTPVPSQPVYRRNLPRASQRSGLPARSQPSRITRGPVERMPLPGSVRSANARSQITVQRGDTLYSLARRHGVTVGAIQSANNMAGTSLRAGESLIIPGGRAVTPRPIAAAPAKRYTVRSGDTLYSIARRHGIAVAELTRRNDIARTDIIRPGQVLRVPGQGAAMPSRTFASNTTGRARYPGASGVRTVRTTTISRPRSETVKPIRVASNAWNVPLPVAKPSDTRTGAGIPNPARRANAAKAAPKKVAYVRELPKPAAMSSTRFRWPVRGRVISSFGPKSDGKHNDGINVAVPHGTSVKSAENGVVAYAGNELKGYGNLVLVRHANNWVTAYAHNDKILVKRGDTVRRGQIIAKAGKSGSVSQPQLHFELRKGSRPVNPMKHMAET